MGLHDGHRPRSKRRYLALGAEGMEDHQLLELLLFYAIPRQDTNPIAHRLLDTFGSLAAVFDATPEELMECKESYTGQYLRQLYDRQHPTTKRRPKTKKS